MGYYIHFESTELKLRKDTPQDIIDFLNNCVNEYKYDFPTPAHKLFTLKRWDNLFIPSAFSKSKPYFKKENEQWKLFISPVINYGREEILEFAKWITPYVIGHKPKEFIGELTGEDHTDRCNVYLERTKKIN